MDNSSVNNEQYFKDWAESYYESARNLKIRIQQKQKEADTCESSKLQELSIQIECLQESYYDCLETARILSAKAARERAKQINRNKNNW